jgi:hypothetical protein
MAWEQDQLDHAVADVFGYHALQLGLPEFEALRANRMPHRWVSSDSLAPPVVLSLPPLDEALSTLPALEPMALHCEHDALPFPDTSLDLVVLPHTLELSRDPHHTLREVERVLRPEGRLVITGFNPASLWGLRQRAGHLWRGVGLGRGQPLYLPRAGEFIGYWRLRDWLRLLGLEVDHARFGCWRPAFRSEAWLQRLDGPGGRALVAGAGRGVLRGRRQAGARHATGGHAQAGAPQGRFSTGGGGQPAEDQDRGATMSEPAGQPDVVIYADGACRGNPGPGGWGAWLRAGAAERELFGGEKLTTNNRMELTAVIQALGALTRRCTPTASTSRTASPPGSTAGRSAAGSRPTRSRSRTPSCGGGWTS